MRKEYGKGALCKSGVRPCPMAQFGEWFGEAADGDGDEANVMALSTLGDGQMPEGRIVLLKGHGPDGFTFYTNYNSNKAKQLDKCPYAAITFYWRGQERQVRARGRVSKVPPAVSDAYFKARPIGSRTGAWASPQSGEIPDRKFLQRKVREARQRFAGQTEVPRPGFWGGYLLAPSRMEFWQGRPDRLHDRIVYELEGGAWAVKRLAP